MKKALIQDGRICDVTDAEFPASPELQWVDVPDDTTTQDTYINGVVIRHAMAVVTPLQQIRAMERTQVVRDAMERASRLANLVTARAELVRQQAARVPPVVVTNDQAHTFLLERDGHYKVLWDLEQAVEPLRKLIV